MADNETFSRYEGLAIATSGRVWRQWSKSLAARGQSIEDACQEGRTALFELLPRLGDPAYTEQQRAAYVKRCVWGRVSNWAKAAARDGDDRERPAPEPLDADGLLDLRSALAQLDPMDAALILARHAGESYREVGAEHGLSAGQAASRVRKALARLKKIMHA